MLSSRGYILSKYVNSLLTRHALNPRNLQSVRNSGHYVQYRTAPKNHSKFTIIGAQLVGGYMWWWILWHLWHEHEHITGEFEYPDPSSWTNAELGIPPDDE